MNNDLIKIQQMLYKQMERLTTGCTRDEIQLEIGRSGALSQNACAYIKSVNVSLKVKEMIRNNPNAEKTILKEIGVLNEE